MSDVEGPRLAGEIVVRRHLGRPGKFSFTIDGREFPWYISEDGISTVVRNSDVPSITVTIVADRVRIEDRMGPATLPDE